MVRTRVADIVWRFATALAGVGVLGLVAAGRLARIDEPVDIGSLQGLERRTGLRFPEGTVLVAARYHAGMAQQLRAMVLVPHEEVRAFFQRRPFSASCTQSRRLVVDRDNFVGTGAIPGWRPDAAARFVAAKAWNRRSNEVLRLQADLERKAGAVVYVVWCVL